MKKIVLILAALAVVSCRSVKYVEVPVIHQDTLYQSKVIRDSIHVHDSTIIERKGDTVFYDRWHTRWRDRIRTDTLYQSKTDTITKTIAVEVEKQKPFLASVRDSVALAVLFFIIGFVANWLRKFKR